MKFSMKLALLASSLSITDASEEVEFTYFEQGETGPSHWANLNIEGNQCGGTLMTSGYGQSPVAIFNELECETDMSAYSFEAGDCTWDDLIFTVGDHGVKVSKGESCSLGSMTIPHTSNSFDALHFHIHTSSEHTIDGYYYEAELHVVHEESTGESFAVFGMMLSSAEGVEDHPDFENLLRGWEKAANMAEEECADAIPLEDAFQAIQERVTCPAVGAGLVEELPFTNPEANLDVYKLPTTPKFGVYTYKGGLTTPPCTEIVNWNVLDTPTLISQSQMNRLYKLTLCYVDPETCRHATIASKEGITARKPQALMGREIVHRCYVCEKCEDIVDFAPTFIRADEQQENEDGSIASSNNDDDEKLGLALGLFAAGTATLLLAFLAYHLYALQQAQSKQRLAVSSRIAQHITIAKSANQLSRIEIIGEVEKYGEYMSKLQFDDLVGSGKVGSMSDGDANALFASLDDGTGKAKTSEVATMLLSAGNATHTAAITDEDSA